jgi:hypothetical protein
MADETVTIPKNPSPGILMSMALRYDHALGVSGFYDQPLYSKSGISHAQRLAGTLVTMRQLYEEVVREGFYQDSKEEEYVSMIKKEDSGEMGNIIEELMERLRGGR